MILIDSSVMIDVWRDKSGNNAELLLAVAGAADIVMTRPIEMEVLGGASDENDWMALDTYLGSKRMFEVTPTTWRSAAQLYFNLRRKGVTIRKMFDCCIAQVAIENKLLLIHDDRDFVAIAAHAPLNQYRLSFKATAP